MKPRLITIPMSNYCEKARWALDWSRLDYVEEMHAPIFSRLAARRAGAPGTVPALVTDDGVFGDSTDILRWVDRQKRLYHADAADLEERFDTALGNAVRILALTHIAPDRKLSRRVALTGTPGWERVLGSVFFGPALGYLRRLYGVSPEGAVRALADVRAGFAEVGARLADGRRYLCGDTFSAADLGFAALAAPMVLPESERPRLPRLDEVGDGMRALVTEMRATAAGRFLVRLYAEDRG